MTAAPHIDPMPAPPSIDDDRYEFDAHAFATVAAQENLVTQLNAFGAWLNESLGSYTVLDDAEEEYELTSDDMGKIYRRTTNAGAKTLIIRPESEHPLQDGGAWLFRNSGAGALTVDVGIGVTVNTPPGSSLIVSADVTFMLIRVAVDEFDLIILSEGIVINPVFGDIDVEGTVTAGESVTAPEFNAYGNSPIFRFKDLNTAGANIDGAIFFYDSTDTVIGKAGYFNANGSYEIENTGRIIRLDSGSVDVTGAFSCGGLATLKNLTIDAASPSSSYIDFKISGTQVGKISFSSATDCVILNGAGSPHINFTASSCTIFNATTILGNLTMANNDVSSVKNLQVNNAITGGGTAQLAKLGVATSSLGSDVLAVNGTSTFYGHTVTNGNTSATGSVTGGSVVSNGDISGSGNLTLSGSGKKISGDFSGSVANRLAFQTSIVNSATLVGFMPSGSSTTTSISAFNSSDPANSSIGRISALSTDVRIDSGVNGSGSYVPITIYTGGSLRQAISVAGDVGFGVASPTTKAKLQTSNGIHLGNSANSNVDVLDYYEEQISFTVVVYGGTSPGSCTYTTRSGKATRTGNDCSGQIVVGWTGHTGTGDLYISGLPFTNFSINAAISIFVDGLVGPAGSTSFQGFGVGGGANISISTIAATTGVKSNVQLGSNANVTNVTINFKYQIL